MLTQRTVLCDVGVHNKQLSYAPRMVPPLRALEHPARSQNTQRTVLVRSSTYRNLLNNDNVVTYNLWYLHINWRLRLEI